MIEDNALRELHRSGLRRMLVLKSSGAEYFVPNAFRLLYTLVAIGTLVLGIYHTHTFSPFDVDAK
jgi:hypothetical protein